MQLQMTSGHSFAFDLTGLKLAWSFGNDAYNAGLALLEQRRQLLADPESPLSLRFRKEQSFGTWESPPEDILKWCLSFPDQVTIQISEGLLADGFSQDTIEAMQVGRVVAASTQPSGRLSAYNLVVSIILAESLALEGEFELLERRVTSLMSSGSGVNFAASEVAMFSENADPRDFVLLHDPLGPVLANAICGFLADTIFTSSYLLHETPFITREHGFRDRLALEATDKFLSQFAAIDAQTLPEHHEYGTVAHHQDVQQTLTRNLLRMIVGHELRHMCPAHLNAPKEHTKRGEQEADVEGLALVAHLAGKAREPLQVPYGINFYFKAFTQLSGHTHTESTESTHPTVDERRRLIAAAVLRVEKQLGLPYEAYRDIDAAVASAGTILMTLYTDLKRQGHYRS